MRQLIMVPMAVSLCALVSLADVHDFPSASSVVVGSVGFIDGERVGFC